MRNRANRKTDRQEEGLKQSKEYGEEGGK
jgi:hypothetical protein